MLGDISQVLRIIPFEVHAYNNTYFYIDDNQLITLKECHKTYEVQLQRGSAGTNDLRKLVAVEYVLAHSCFRPYGAGHG